MRMDGGVAPAAQVGRPGLWLLTSCALGSAGRSGVEEAPAVPVEGGRGLRGAARGSAEAAVFVWRKGLILRLGPGVLRCLGVRAGANGEGTRSAVDSAWPSV